MKKIIGFLTIAALLSVGCSNNKESYTPAEPESGAQYFFPAGTETNLTIAEGVESFDFTVMRVVKDAAAEVIIAVTDTSKTIFESGEGELIAEFEAGENSTTVSIPVDFTNYEFGDKIGVDLVITEQTTFYAPAKLHIVAEYPEPWVSLGIGDFADNWWWELNGPVEIQQNAVKPNQFRIVGPFDSIMEAAGGTIDDMSDRTEYAIITIMKPGDVLAGQTITHEDLVFYDDISTGYYHSSYGATVWVCHPGTGFTSTKTEDTWLNNKVLFYQDDAKTLPAQIQLAPWYYMFGVGGWNQSQTEGAIVITFPGVVLADYTSEVSFEGLLTDKLGDKYLEASAVLGPDVEYAKVVAVPSYGEDDEDAAANALALIAEDGEGVVTIEKSGEFKLPFPEEFAEYYLIVLVPFGNGEAQVLDAAYDLFQFKDFGITLTLAEPETDAAGNGSVKATLEFGEDTEAALVAIAPGKDKAGFNAALNLILSGDSSVIFVEEEGDVNVAIDGEGDFTVIAVSYAEGELWNFDYDSFEYFAVNPWEYLGVGSLTDDIVCPNYDTDPITVPCNVYNNTITPGLYKITDFQLPFVAVAFEVSEDEMRQYEGGNWRNSPLIIDATDPENVFIEEQDYGICLSSQDGFVGVTSLYNGKPFSVGTLADGVISFPTPNGLLCTFGGKGYYYANQNGAFKVVLPAPGVEPAIAKRSNVRISDSAKAEMFAPVKKAASKQLKPSAVSVAHGKLAAKGKAGKSLLQSANKF